MAFVYNNKLPFHIWGVDSRAESYGFTNSSFEKFGRLDVPIPEDGAPRVYRLTPFGVTASSTISSFAAEFEDTPCDAQLPIVDVIGQVGSSYVYGLALTLHGELYQFPALRLPWRFGPQSATVDDVRRLARISSADVQEPFSKLCVSVAVLKNSVLYGPVVITKSGRVFRVAHFAGVFSGGRWNDRPLLDEITVPTAAEWYHDQDGLQIVTTTEPRTYVRRNSSAAWSTLTTGCHLVKVAGQLNAQFRSAAPPVATVDEPPAGTQATVAVEWDGAGTVNDPYTINAIRISNPGSGYTTDPAVTFSVTPSAGTANVTLKVFSGTLRKAFNRGQFFLSDDDKFWAIETPTPAAANPPDFPLRWATEYKTTTTTKNAGGTYDKPLSNVQWKESDNTRSTVLLKHILDSSGALFELKETGRVTGSSTTDYNPELVAKFEQVNDGPWRSVAYGSDLRVGTPVVFCGVKTDGTMWTWGKNGESTSNLQYALFADGSNLQTSRTTPAQIATQADWLHVFDIAGSCFLAVRKDAICREINQPMEYWPDQYFS